uniref:Uncharacterized protein n=1 Tax=Arundo donax TaxID=35708 RepID=A0A0A9GRJ1_ARUDO
MPILQLSKIP